MRAGTLNHLPAAKNKWTVQSEVHVTMGRHLLWFKVIEMNTPLDGFDVYSKHLTIVQNWYKPVF